MMKNLLLLYLNDIAFSLFVKDSFVFFFVMIWSNEEWTFISNIYFYFCVWGCPYSSLKLNASSYLSKMSIISFFLFQKDMIFLNLYIIVITLCLTHFSFHHLYLTIDIYHLIPLFPFFYVFTISSYHSQNASGDSNLKYLLRFCCNTPCLIL